jgi:hypothetical protein
MPIRAEMKVIKKIRIPPTRFISARILLTVSIISEALAANLFAEAVYKLRNLAGEKVELYGRLPNDPGELFGRLFGKW